MIDKKKLCYVKMKLGQQLFFLINHLNKSTHITRITWLTLQK